ncbi:hypothetical protein PsorP6_016284 [Peronosclerospora sorghi]|uniref:Uncharacterized protein n=1 Tax=Peronosclerospora sorghi TaxID=230839 RepID=A0ACC0VMJ1_9STRA|nr:hypothetical protein PsorP6_016284 [Peronosclerospora sorghi]
MLLNVVPSAKQPETSAENSHEVEAAAASFYVSPTSKHELKPMSNGERIARKYGIVAAAKIPPNDSMRAQVGIRLKDSCPAANRELAFSQRATETEVASPGVPCRSACLSLC